MFSLYVISWDAVLVEYGCLLASGHLVNCGYFNNCWCRLFSPPCMKAASSIISFGSKHLYSYSETDGDGRVVSFRLLDGRGQLPSRSMQH